MRWPRQTAENLGILLLVGVAPAVLAQSPAYTFAAGTAGDEAQIRHIITDNDNDNSDSQMASNEDWENAFGVRFNDLKARDAFYNSVVKPLIKNATDNSTLEVKIRFIKPDVAVADEYWHIAGQIDQATNKPGADRWGRSTDTFVKQPDGKWLEVLERITDLRSPYYKHYDAIPAPADIPAATLAAYAGKYDLPGKNPRTVIVKGRSLEIQGSTQGVVTAIPESAASFLCFIGGDPSDYFKVVFPAGGTRMEFHEASGEPFATFTRVN